MGSSIEKLMKMTNATEENVLRALYGCTGNVKNAYLFEKRCKITHFYAKQEENIQEICIKYANNVINMQFLCKSMHTLQKNMQKWAIFWF